MIECLGDPKQRREAAHDALIGVVQRRISNVVAGGTGLSIVVSNQRSNDIAVASVEAGHVAVEGEIFAMLMVAAMTDHVPDVVQQSGSFEQHARLRGQMVHWLQLVEEDDAELADVLGMLLIILQPACKTAGA